MPRKREMFVTVDKAAQAAAGLLWQPNGAAQGVECVSWAMEMPFQMVQMSCRISPLAEDRYGLYLPIWSCLSWGAGRSNMWCNGSLGHPEELPPYLGRGWKKRLLLSVFANHPHWTAVKKKPLPETSWLHPRRSGAFSHCFSFWNHSLAPLVLLFLIYEEGRACNWNLGLPLPLAGSRN